MTLPIIGCPGGLLNTGAALSASEVDRLLTAIACARTLGVDPAVFDELPAESQALLCRLSIRPRQPRTPAPVQQAEPAVPGQE